MAADDWRGRNSMRAPAMDVDSYLAALPTEMKAALSHLRKTIRSAAPGAEEVISYQIPTFKFHGSLVSFGAAKNHCSFFVMSPAVMEAHQDDLKPYDTSKGTIRFPASKPLPAALVRKLVKARIEENLALVAKKKAAR